MQKTWVFSPEMGSPKLILWETFPIENDVLIIHSEKFQLTVAEFGYGEKFSIASYNWHNTIE